MPKGNGKPISKVKVQNNFSNETKVNLLESLKSRFEKNTVRHRDIKWNDVQSKLESNNKALGSLFVMESTGGEPDVIGFDKKLDKFIFCDCSEQSPDRRSICYDKEGEDMRNKKGIFPGGNAVELAKQMGIELLGEEEYRMLQELGDFDTKTSSWLKTPADIRKLGGALFGDKRYGTVFIYHNGAESFYSARGFRGILRV